MNLYKLSKYRFTMQMRLIPINKISPNIPNKEQIRPIVVMSHVIKMIELFYEERLKEYVSYYINPEQIGFFQGMGTQIHIQEVTRFLQRKQVKGKTAIFIDLSNAYNVVDRQILYNIMKKRQILVKRLQIFNLINIWGFGQILEEVLNHIIIL
ncbi:unnamed protein product [Paramecium sonneborni]|uniref:Reverse transcriptase domain-containing protein n=1 Tax=Paramecium sonneborni TaxID=65129 RepID=A0A8S1P795_9CILI|nr:unnamed protein product [Paramecium sonneborni]